MSFPFRRCDRRPRRLAGGGGRELRSVGGLQAGAHTAPERFLSWVGLVAYRSTSEEFVAIMLLFSRIQCSSQRATPQTRPVPASIVRAEFRKTCATMPSTRWILVNTNPSTRQRRRTKARFDCGLEGTIRLGQLPLFLCAHSAFHEQLATFTANRRSPQMTSLGLVAETGQTNHRLDLFQAIAACPRRSQSSSPQVGDFETRIARTSSDPATAEAANNRA